MLRNAFFILLMLCSDAHSKSLKERKTGSQAAALSKNKSLRLGSQRHLKRGGKNSESKNSVENSDTTDVPADLFEGTETQEPESWPKCVGMTVDSCKSHILSTTTKPAEFVLMLPTDIAIKNYLWERVRIYHDKSSPKMLVLEPAPGRG